MKKIVTSALDKLPYIRGLKRELSNYERWGLPGHFYNPIPDMDEIRLREKKIFNTRNYEQINGIDLNYDFQKGLLENFKELYQELPFPEKKNNDFLYFYDNPNYSYSDAIFTYCIIRHFKPKKIIEIGSGYSSCLFIDLNNQNVNSINCLFIEPYPDLLLKLAQVGKTESINILSQKVQDIDISLFLTLDENDVLFIDSSHVVKTGSDLHHIFFNIIPILKKGVLIHFHDIFYPFEYPKEWILSLNRAWNEIYMLKSFLMYNYAFKIVVFNTFLEEKMPEWFKEKMPLCLKNKGGSIWIQKII